MLNRKIETAEPKPTEAQVQVIAKAEYEQVFSELCTKQRSTPYYADAHSAANRAFVDYYDRLIRNGGHMSLLPQEEPQLTARGWDDKRIAELRHIVKLREDKGITRLRDEIIDARLRAVGVEPTDEARWMVELALYPAYRDAHLEAEAELLKSVGTSQDRSWSQASTGNAPSPVAATIDVVPAHAAPTSLGLDGSAVPEAWRYVTPTEAAEKLIAYRPALWEHRKKGKRAVAQVGEQTLRQIRWAATLLEKSTNGRPMWALTHDELKTLDMWFDKLPLTCGKAPWHRKPETTLDAICLDAEDRIEDGTYQADVIGLDVGTTNKHFRKLGQIYKFVREQTGGILPLLDFGQFVAPDRKDERAARAAYSIEQGRELFSLPPWNGCSSVEDRLSVGDNVFHDALYYVLLLVWYTGMRREEVCKLLVDDVQECDGIWFFDIKITAAGGVKNATSVRLVAISDELVRLGFIEYVHAIRAAGHDAVFPELVSQRKNAKKGDTFYKLWWVYIKPLLPSLRRGQALHAARHMVATELKELEIFKEFRDDALGQKGEGEGATRYAKATRVKKVLAVVNKIPVVTDHLLDHQDVRLLPLSRRQPRPQRVTATSSLLVTKP